MAEFKFPCPQCGQNIQCDMSYSGAQINCPTCQKAIVVPQAPRSGAAQPAVPAKSRTWRNVLVIAASVIVLAGLVIGGWYGYSKIRIYIERRHLPSGVVALWSGDGNGKDSAGWNNGTLTDITFAKGKVGQAFHFNGKSSFIKIPASQSLNVGEGDGLTVSAWIKPSDVNGFHPILEWNPSKTTPGVIGVQLWIGNRPDSHGVLFASVTGTDHQSHVLASQPGTVATGRFQFVALTYGKTSGAGVLYLDGIAVAQSQWDSFIPLTKGDLWISRRPTDHRGDWTYNKFFAGLMNEIAIYNRAFSASEIQAIYEKQNNGGISD